MRTITSSEELNDFQNDRSLVSLFIDHAYNAKTIELIFGMRTGFNMHVGQAWHLLVPYRSAYAVDVPLSAEDFDIELSRKIIEQHGISHRKVPALVFEFVPGREFYLATLGKRTDDQIINIVGSIADIARAEVKNGPDDLLEFRKQLHRKVLFFLKKEDALGILNKAAPNLLGFLGAL